MFASKDIFLKSSGGYQISRSVRLRSSASAYFNRTFGAGSQTTWTFSAWVKLGTLGTDRTLLSCGSGATDSVIYFQGSTNQILLNLDNVTYRRTTQVFRDPSAWYHIVVVLNTSNATAQNRLRLYINGAEVTDWALNSTVALNATPSFNSAIAHNMARYISGASLYFDGYMTEINFIDGQALTPSSFGETNSVTGVWQPKRYAGTYGTNGFYLNFSDNSGVTATTIGKDYSGNGNNWTPNNISVTAGVTYDSMLDVPTPYADGGTGRGNYAVGNPLAVNVTTSATATLTNGNLLLTNGSATYSGFPSTMSIPVTGKWAWKFKVTGSVSGSNDGYIGFACNSSGNPVTGASSGAAANWFTTVQVQAVSDRGVVHKYAGGSVVTDAAGSGGTGATGDEWEFLIDRDAGTTIVKINGTTKATVTGLPATQELFPFATFYQTSGYFIFDYTPSDTSYKTLNTQNLPTPTISNGATVMAATTYTGNGSTQTINNSVNGVSFAPDLVWVKVRSSAATHGLIDSVRGAGIALASNLTDAERNNGTGAGGDVIAFNSNGFNLGNNTTGSATNSNLSGSTYVAWQWNAGGSTVTNTSGTISAQVRANATAGFSVVTYTGTGSAATVGHGLGVAPQMILIFERSPGGDDHIVYHASLPSNQYSIRLNTTAAQAGPSGAYWNSTSPTSSVFSVGTSGESNQSTATYVAYCFAPIAGYSAFGSYTGNGSTDGPFVYLGFRPRWVMFKKTSATSNWSILDTSRDGFNVADNPLLPNTSGAESTSTSTSGAFADILSNGFKLRGNSGDINDSGATYIYAAFAEVPFKVANAR